MVVARAEEGRIKVRCMLKVIFQLLIGFRTAWKNETIKKLNN